MATLKIVHQDITTLEADCIVNAANEYLMPGDGVCEAIFRAAGYEELYSACAAVGHCDCGSAVITDAFRLKAKYIIHTVGPVWNGGVCREEATLKKCYSTAMGLAKAKGCKSIAFPLIASGVNGYPIMDAWKTAIDTIEKEALDLDVTIAVINKDIYRLGADYLAAMELEKNLLDSVDWNKLCQCIEMLCRIRKIEWVAPKTEDNGVIHLGYPQYPHEVFDVFQLMRTDYKYRHNLDAFPKGLLPGQMTAGQIQTALTYISRAERFSEGILTHYVEDGTLLKMLLRLRDLILQHKGKNLHW